MLSAPREIKFKFHLLTAYISYIYIPYFCIYVYSIYSYVCRLYRAHAVTKRPRNDKSLYKSAAVSCCVQRFVLCLFGCCFCSVSFSCHIVTINTKAHCD